MNFFNLKSDIQTSEELGPILDLVKKQFTILQWFAYDYSVLK